MQKYKCVCFRLNPPPPLCPPLTLPKLKLSLFPPYVINPKKLLLLRRIGSIFFHKENIYFIYLFILFA